MNNIHELFCDGGCCLANPSPYCAQWAYCQVDIEGNHIREMSGIILRASNPDLYHIKRSDRMVVVPSAEINPNGLTNQLSELVALTLGVESLPCGWGGTIYSDSESALGRMFGSKSMGGIPEEWSYRCQIAPERLGEYSWVLLGGHPTQADLLSGIRAARPGKRALPCSKHQHWCDLEAKRLGNLFSRLMRQKAMLQEELCRSTNL